MRTSIVQVITINTLLLLLLFMGVLQSRKPDGTLKCYQCQTAGDKTSACGLKNWKDNSYAEKRLMIMSCTRRKSSFCSIITEDGGDSTTRGCAGPRYSNGKEAHVGCTNMGDNKRLCLCDTNLCNKAVKLVPQLILILINVFVFVFNII